MNREVILPIEAPVKQRAISLASNLANRLAQGHKAGMPIGKYGSKVCEVFKIPLLPGENPVKIAFDKLIEWRTAIGFGVVKAYEYERLLPALQKIYGQSEELGIRGAIAAELKTRDKRRAAMRNRKPKENYRRSQNDAAPLYYSDEPYGD